MRPQYRFYVEISVEERSKASLWRPVGGGTIIRSNWVLTCAHIFGGVYKDVNARARRGTRGVDEEVIFESEGEFFKHGDYKPRSYQNDIALVKLYDHVVQTNDLGFASLPRFNANTNRYTQITHNSQFRFCGRGSNIEKESNGNLNYGYAFVVPMERCKESYVKSTAKSLNVNTQLCAGMQNSNFPKIGYVSAAGPGDSGGGMIKTHGGQDYVYGVISFGTTNLKTAGTIDGPDVYVKVSNYVDWIKDKIEKKNDEPIQPPRKRHKPIQHADVSPQLLMVLAISVGSYFL